VANCATPVGTPNAAMSTVGTICQILAVVFVVLHLIAHPEDWRRYLVVFAAVIVVIVVGASLGSRTARAVVLIGGLVAIGVAVRVYDARRPNRSRTRR
jgi:energy-coupling factor transporter transmembrane protein EcfT